MHRLTLLLLLCVPFWIAWINPLRDPLRSKTEAAHDFFEQGQYEEALRQYSSALQDAPHLPELHYNLGAVRYRRNEFEEAIQELDLAERTTHPEVAARTHYNRGSARFRLQDYEGALEEFKNALKINPNDEDAKFNIEFIRQIMAQEPPPQQQQDDQQEQDESEEQQQQNQEQQQDEQQEQEQQPQDSEEQDQQQEEQPSEGETDPEDLEDEAQPEPEPQPRPEQQERPQEMTQEQAEMILNRLDQKERDMRQERRQQIRAQHQIDRDW